MTACNQNENCALLLKLFMKFDLKLNGFIERQNYEWHANEQKKTDWKTFLDLGKL